MVDLKKEWEKHKASKPKTSVTKQEAKEKLGKKVGVQIKPSDNRIDYMLSQEKKPFKCMSIGVHNDHFYYGSILYYGSKKVPVTILDDGRVYYRWVEKVDKETKIDDEIQDEFGLKYRFELFDDVVDNLWSNKSIKQFKDGKAPKINFLEMYEKIKNKNQELVYHSDKRVHSYVACDIISNYCYPLFNAKGRTYFKADFASGKSRQSLIYQKLSFNSLFASSISPASFERVIESTGGTIIVDNFDNVNDELKAQILQVIEVYYKKGGKNIKSDGKNHRPIAYNGYSPLVINNIVGLPEVTESRCNTINMLKTLNKKIVDKKIDEKDIFWETTKDQLHILILQNWKKVEKEYENLEVPELNSRDLERTEAVLSVAKCISKEVYQDVLEFILETNEQQSIKELSDNWEFLIFDLLNGVLKDKTEVRIMVKEITESLAVKIVKSDKTAKSDKLKFSHYVGKVLKSVPIFKKKVIDGWVNYLIKRDDLDKMLKIKGFDKYLTIPHLTTLNNTNHTNHTLNDNNKNNKNNNLSDVVRYSEVVDHVENSRNKENLAKLKESFESG